MQIIFPAVAVLLLFVGLPLWMVLSLRRKSMGEIMFGGRGERTSRGGVGNALQELDRLLARPSMEYRVEAEDTERLTQDENGGE
jgi:hypothetical protein